MSKGIYVEFHCHSVLSDGVLTLDELVEKAIENQIGVMSITDHNRLLKKEEYKGLIEKSRNRIDLIEGIEVSTNYDTEDGTLEEIHIVVLTKDGDKIRFLENRKLDHRGRFNELREKLALCGVEIPDYDTFLTLYPDTGHSGRKHVADYMYKNGMTTYPDEAFDLYFGRFGKKLAYVDSTPYRAAYGRMEETVREIIEAGGDSILAVILCHPFYYEFDEKELKRMMTRFKEAAGPLAGMEVLYRRYNQEQRDWLKEKAEEFGFVKSAGSDYHGQSDQDGMDNCFPMEIWEDIKANWKRVFHKE